MSVAYAPVVQLTGGAAASRRVFALIRRHAYLLLKSWARLL